MGNTPARKTFWCKRIATRPLHSAAPYSRFYVCPCYNLRISRQPGISNAGLLRKLCAIPLSYNVIYHMKKALVIMQSYVNLTRSLATYSFLTFFGVILTDSV
ncbi:hypothetical protein CEXT_753651 [Caerostris extrusa]|uniref:Uncharacterized protein n=1 Tax=Caerostris extrusa TaxID=172846 RepID=A0AAV4NMQ4_CAEEX|nr:hypothetical protein CEXT_753651 [Caerostris extrusa]